VAVVADDLSAAQALEHGPALVLVTSVRVVARVDEAELERQEFDRQFAVARLGMLAERVIGFTYQDLTTKPVRLVRMGSGASRWSSFSKDDYWRMNKSHIVLAHVDWLKPQAWIAVDDESILWPRSLANHVCIVDGCKGLADPAEQDRLLTYLQMNFGPGGQR